MKLPQNSYKIVFILLMFLAFSWQSKATSGDPIIPKVHIGDELIINAPEHLNFQGIQLPKRNFLLKQGQIPNYKSLYGKKVKVIKIVEKEGYTEITLSAADGKNFFKHHKTLKANLQSSFTANELRQF